jgi:hypothetical protein
MKLVAIENCRLYDRQSPVTLKTKQNIKIITNVDAINSQTAISDMDSFFSFILVYRNSMFECRFRKHWIKYNSYPIRLQNTEFSFNEDFFTISICQQ